MRRSLSLRTPEQSDRFAETPCAVGLDDRLQVETDPRRTPARSGLRFTQVALKRSQANKEEELAVSFTKAYEETLKKHHSFVVRPVFGVRSPLALSLLSLHGRARLMSFGVLFTQLAMKACPYRKDFYAKLGPPSAPIDSELDKWNSALGAILDRLEQFYVAGKHDKGF